MRKKCADTKSVIRSRKSKEDRHYNGQRKGAKGQAMIYKIIHKKRKIEQYETHY